MSNTAEKIAVMQAYADGREIECMRIDMRGSMWEPTRHPNWDWVGCDYRVKSVPREWWIAPQFGAVFTTDPGTEVKFEVGCKVYEIVHVREVLHE